MRGPSPVAGLVGRGLAGAGEVILAAGLALFGHQACLRAKGMLAEALIDRAWRAHLLDGRPHRPWSWADITPVARLRVPRLGIDRPVLSGAAGSTLAFGLGLLDGTAGPGKAGVCAVAGHRDTWAAFLADLRPGDAVILETREGSSDYRVVSLEVVDRRERLPLEAENGRRLALVTCYPFGAVRRGPLRYIVTCQAASG